MVTVDKILITFSILNCVLSLFAVRLVRLSLKKKQKIEKRIKKQNAIARAREKSRIELSVDGLNEVIAAASLLKEGSSQQIISVNGTRTYQDI